MKATVQVMEAIVQVMAGQTVQVMADQGFCQDLSRLCPSHDCMAGQAVQIMAGQTAQVMAGQTARAMAGQTVQEMTGQTA